ncbi:hypothetical protein [Streptomyces sp. ADI93-02]|uniref:ABC transporter permease n=1 Tax=Streptomyces sp. ADI93-02 TaxID=1522757 RepID=UPI000F550A55|nr:hypothetical protein [Streptomyces sp. ADI93-02]RPK53594.1 ABC-2 family transporter protein [Streptomyces sp. ADI93-02]
MSTLTPVRPSLRGPARVVMRQHRWTLRIAGGVALAAVIALIAVALRSSHVAEVFAASDCRVDGGTGRICDQTVRDYLDSMLRYRSLFGGFATFLMILPALFSAFVAGPMIARELESGTFRMSWTQSVSPARWLAAKLAVPTVLLLAATAVLSAVLHWAQSHSDTPYLSEWYTPQVFAATGTVPAAHLLFGMGAGALIGLLVRRTVPALAASVLVTGVVTVAFAYLRRGLWPPSTLTGATLSPAEDIWWVEVGDINGSGERIPHDVCSWSGAEAERLRCMADQNITGHYLGYHPASHFWPIQLVETGILLALATLAVAAAFRVLRRRTG